jgi:nucleoside 2-deoxyribosyltransferase
MKEIQAEMSDILETVDTKGILYKTKTYLVGAMEFKNGEDWRNKVTTELKKMGIVGLDPYHKPFMHGFDESEGYKQKLFKLREIGEYEELAKHCKAFRSYDLNLVDRCDFIIFYYDCTVPTIGSFEEFFWANRLKKPVFVIVEQGKSKAPLWLFGTIPHKYIYNSVNEVIDQLKKINSGEIDINQDRWRLLKPEYR